MTHRANCFPNQIDLKGLLKVSQNDLNADLRLMPAEILLGLIHLSARRRRRLWHNIGKENGVTPLGPMTDKSCQQARGKPKELR
jgi:hypothetical protein